MLEKKDLARILLEIMVDESKTLEEDLASKGIEEETFKFIVDEMARQTIFNIRSGKNLPSSLRTEIVSSFFWGYKCALELEMQRLVEG